MYWMRRPPYLRWLAAASILAVALGVEFSDRRTVPHPFLAVDVAPGVTITEADLEWRQVPSGLLSAPPLDDPRAAHQLRRGEPLLASSTAEAGLAPRDWWSIPLALPATAAVGATVRLVVLSRGGFEESTTAEATIDGVVIEAGNSDTFAMAGAGLVAVPPESAAVVAVAAADNRLMVLFRP